jgi:hypothetical protein
MNSSHPKSDFIQGNGIRLHYLDWAELMVLLSGS